MEPFLTRPRRVVLLTPRLGRFSFCKIQDFVIVFRVQDFQKKKTIFCA